MSDVQFVAGEKIYSFNAPLWLTKGEQAFTEACKAEKKFAGPDQDKLIKDAWKAIKGTSAAKEKASNTQGEAT